MSEAKSGDKVKVHYTGKLKDGTVFDSSEGREPLEFEIGSRRLLGPFEDCVIGMKSGETRTISIEPEEGYGLRTDELVLEIEKSNFPEDIKYEVGQRLQMEQPNGDTFAVTVADVGEATVKLDANHPLAGEVLQFEIELVDIS